MKFSATCVFIVCAFSAHAQVSYGVAGSTYSEDFNSLPTSGTFQNLDGMWLDGVTLPGWSRVLTSDGTPGVENRWRVDDGNAPGGSLYCYGTFGSSDRALGFVTSSNIPVADVGMALRNDTGLVLTWVQIDYVGEQWRHGTADAQSLAFSYGLGNASLLSGTFTAASSLDFHAPRTVGPNAGLDGNLASNRVAISGSLNGLTWLPGQVLWLRWTGMNAAAGDHGLSVDDLRMRAVPEPSSAAVLLLGAGFLRRRQRRN